MGQDSDKENRDARTKVERPPGTLMPSSDAIDKLAKGKFYMHDDRDEVSDAASAKNQDSTSITDMDINGSDVELPLSVISTDRAASRTSNASLPLDSELQKILSGSKMDKVFRQQSVSVVTVTNTGQLCKYGKNKFPPPNSSNFKQRVSSTELEEERREEEPYVKPQRNVGSPPGAMTGSVLKNRPQNPTRN